MVHRHELTDAQWARLEPLLPSQRSRTGRPAHDHRVVLNGILWILRTGAPWRDLPERYGPWQTVYSRFRRWQLAGVWDRVFAELQRQADAAGRLDWAVHFVDGTHVRAHPDAAGARRQCPDGTKRGMQSRRRTPRWGAVAAAGAASSTSAPKGGASRSPSW